MALQHLRSSTADKRPTPAAMSDGQLALNTNLASPGLFFKDSNGDSVKIGPVHIGTTAPNATPGAGGQAGNSKGEAWLDTTAANPILKVFNGSAFVAVQPVGTGTVVSTTDTGTVTSTMILDGTILNADINASAAIVDTKLATIATGGKVSGTAITSGNISTSGSFTSTSTVTGTNLIPTGSGVPTNGIYLPAANSVAVATNGTGRLFVDASTNGTDGRGLTIYSGATNPGSIAFARGTTGTNTYAGLIKYEHTNGSLQFRTEAVERLRITSAGLVGIGTSSPNATLDIESSSGTAVKIRLASNTSNRALVFSNAAETIGWTVGNGVIASARQFVVYDNEAGAARLLIDSSGNVGIGTTSPGHDIDLRKDAAGSTVTLRVRNDNVAADSNSALVLDTPNGVWGVRALRAGNRLAVDIGGSEKAAIDTSGRLLVGTSSSLGGTGSGSLLQAVASGGLQLALGNTATSYSADTLVSTISFHGNVGGSYGEFANIQVRCDGASSSNSDVPGRLVFSTTADGAASPTERMRIDSNGNFGVGLAGGFSGTSNVYFPGAFSTTTANAANVNVAATTGLLARSTSSIVYKTQVEDLETTKADAILSLRPVWYRSLCEGDRKDWSWYGLIAEEVANIEPRLVFWRNTELVENEEGEQIIQDLDQPVPEGVMYDRVTVLLLDVVKRQQQTIEALEARLTAAGI
jgi:hypothetical protein